MSLYTLSRKMQKEEGINMKKRISTVIVIALTVSVLLIPTLLYAQGELTLKGLAEQLTALVARIEKLEAAHATTSVDGYCKLPNDFDHLDTEAESKWEALTEEETLNSFRKGLEFNAEEQTISYYFQERFDGDYYGLFVYYDSECNPTVGEWEILAD